MKETLSDQDVRAITDFRILYSTLVSLYAGINRGRAAYDDHVVAELAQLDVVRDALKKTERIHAWLTQLQDQVIEEQKKMRPIKPAVRMKWAS
jgi:hypothetical protein